MSVTLIVSGVAVIAALLAFWGWRRSIKLKTVLLKTQAIVDSLERNLATIKMADEYDQIATTKIFEIDKEIVNAKTQADASRIRRRFVSGVYNGL